MTLTSVIASIDGKVATATAAAVPGAVADYLAAHPPAGGGVTDHGALTGWAMMTTPPSMSASLLGHRGRQFRAPETLDGDPMTLGREVAKVLQLGGRTAAASAIVGKVPR